MKKSVSRRSFLTTTAAVGTAAALTGLAGCSAQEATSGDSSSTTSDAANSGIDTSSEIVSGESVFESDPIADSDVAETIDADVLVIGGGVSGSFAAATAAELGMQVVVLQKEATAISNGSGAAAWHSQAALEAMESAAAELGVEPDSLDFDPWQAIMDWQRNGGENRGDLKLAKAWICNSGPTMDWAIPLTNDVEGVGPVYAPTTFGWEYEDEWTRCYPTVHAWAGEMQPLAQWMLDYAAENGADVRYSTPAVQLATDGTSVVGAYGKTEDGTYILVNAQATILAAGDYGNNPQLRAQYVPFIAGLPSAYCVQSNTGDGHLMAMAVGGKMQLSPHTGNIHYDPPVGVPDVCGSGFPWLRVNVNGERFSNEDVTYGQIYAADMNQPGLCHFQVFDDNFRTDWENMGNGMMRTEPTMDIEALTDEAADNGEIARVDTIEELAEWIGCDVTTLQSTIDRYNELCDGGIDLDYGKQARRMKPVRQAPFYAVKRQAGLLCSLNGIITNEKCQALNADGDVIEGLYCVGNCQGNFFGGLEHPMVIPGMSLGRAMTTGRIAGLYASGQDDQVVTELEL